MPDPIADGGKARMPDDAIERRIAEVLTRDRSSGLCPLDGPCASCDCFDPLHEYDRANAKAVMAEVVTPELGRLRNRITALEANGSELLARAERAERLAAICSCGSTYEAYQGPEVDCAVHGAVRAFNEAQAAIDLVRALHIAEPGQHPDFCWHDKHELPCPTLAALDAPESNADAPSPVTAATEAHGEAGGAEDA